MQAGLLNILLAFMEGLALILSPCILPILPIILAGSIEGSKKRPLGIIVGFIITFALFTFFSRKLVLYTGVDLEWIRHISYALLIMFGIIMISTYLTEKLNMAAQRLTNIGSDIKFVNNAEGGFISGILFGGLVGIIWTPCAGPILAAVIVQTVIQQTSLNSFLTVLSFGIGAAVPMLLIAWFGRSIMNQFHFFKTHTVMIRKIIGIIIITAVVYMVYAERFPSTSSQTAVVFSNQDKVINPVEYPYPAPAIENIAAWINSKPLMLNQLKGNVVLIDFWTYSCINCIRTLPYLKDWYAKYHDKGLVIIGIHAPEFEFEKNLDNVKNAVQKNGILYPVALDNHFTTWQNYANRYWPAHYLIDKTGKVVYRHFGEGEYDVTENNIRYLLGLNKMRLPSIESDVVPDYQTPETYLGSARADRFISPLRVMEGISSDYTYPTELPLHGWALQGRWRIGLDRVTSAKANASVEIRFNASTVFVVMGSVAGHPIQVKILLDGKPINSISVDKHQLYEALRFEKPTTGVLQLIANDPGLEVYTFTFG